jgi:DNA-binding GntR family transcriptional regulator
MDAVCARDAAGASRAMRAHLENAYLRMANQFAAALEMSPAEGAS